MAAGDEARRKQCLAARDVRGAARPHEATLKPFAFMSSEAAREGRRRARKREVKDRDNGGERENSKRF